jgi:anti-sigma regulatory factor (Ser/Thr protein kinase)
MEAGLESTRAIPCSPPARAMSSPPVTLSVPADPHFAKIARYTVAHLAGSLGFSYDDVEDLRVAVDELCFLLVGAHGRPGTMTLIFSSEKVGATDGPVLAIVGELVEAEPKGEEPTPEAIKDDSEHRALSVQVLEALVDTYTSERDGETVRLKVVSHRPGRQ